MQNILSSSEVAVVLSAAATLLAKLHISGMEIRTTANGQLALVSARTTSGQPLYVEVVIGSSTDEASGSGGSPGE